MIDLRPTPFSLLIPVAAAVLMAAGCGDRPGSIAAPASPSRPAAAVKPGPPLDLELWIENDPAPGAVVRLGCAVTPGADSAACELSVILPDGLTVTEGNRTWRGPVACGRRQAHGVGVRVPDGRPYVVQVSASIDLGGGARAARTAELVINGPAPAKPAPSAGELKTNSRGETILEMKEGPR
jgi:hypothetical protein